MNSKKLLNLVLLSIITMPIIASYNLPSRAFNLGITANKFTDRQSATTFNECVTQFRTAYTALFTACSLIAQGPTKTINALTEIKEKVDPTFCKYLILNKNECDLIQKNCTTIATLSQHLYPNQNSLDQETIAALNNHLLTNSKNSNQPESNQPRFFLAIPEYKNLDAQTVQTLQKLVTQFRTAYTALFTLNNTITEGPQKALSYLNEVKAKLDPYFNEFLAITPEQEALIEKNHASLAALCAHLYPTKKNDCKNLTDALKDNLLN